MTELNIISNEKNDVNALGAELFNVFGDDEAELEKLFASDLATIEYDATISQDLDGFAKGFPNWDVHPPR